MKLIFIEGPGKKPSIEKYAGKEYKVMAENDYWYLDGTEWKSVKTKIDSPMGSQTVITNQAKLDEIIQDSTKGKIVKNLEFHLYLNTLYRRCKRQ